MSRLEELKKLSDAELISRIEKLKKEKNAVILVHLYQNLNIHPVADFIGDSLLLAQQAAKTDADIIVFCGVDFMAESAKILSPNKKVILPEKMANCPMAHMADRENVRKLKEKHQDAVVITYINSTAGVKAESDVICTSSNALKIVNHYQDRKIIFTPDKHLGNYCKEQTNTDIILWDGHCYVHDRFSADDVNLAKLNHPNCTLLVHPESPKEVVDLADFVGSTSQIIKHIEDNIDGEKGFIIGTEIEVSRLMQQKYPDKKIFQLADHAICKTMKMTQLHKVLYALETETNIIEVDSEVADKALLALNKMLELSK